MLSTVQRQSLRNLNEWKHIKNVFMNWIQTWPKADLLRSEERASHQTSKGCQEGTDAWFAATILILIKCDSNVRPWNRVILFPCARRSSSPGDGMPLIVMRRLLNAKRISLPLSPSISPFLSISLSLSNSLSLSLFLLLSLSFWPLLFLSLTFSV